MKLTTIHNVKILLFGMHLIQLTKKSGNLMATLHRVLHTLLLRLMGHIEVLIISRDLKTGTGDFKAVNGSVRDNQFRYSRHGRTHTDDPSDSLSKITPTSQITVNNNWTEPSRCPTVVPFLIICCAKMYVKIRETYESLLSFPEHVVEVVNKMF